MVFCEEHPTYIMIIPRKAMPVCVDHIKFYDNMKKKQINFHKNHTFFALNFAKMSPIPPLVKRREPVLHIYPRLESIQIPAI